jgi:Ca-activated chloride channel homolog
MRATRAFIVVLGLGVAPLVSATFGQQVEGPSIQIVSPADGTYVKGPTALTVAVEPPGSASNVIIYVDGKQACAVSRAPFSCEWDAGTTVTAHQVRAVVNLAAGGRVVRTASTKALENLFSLSVDTVEVLATVTSGSRLVRGLGQEAFHIFEDEVPQTIVQFASDDQPLELVVAVDLSTSVAPAMPQLKQAVKEFSSSLSPDDRVTLLGFNDRVFTLTRREADPAVRVAAVDKLVASGNTALYDVILAGLDLLDRQAGRRALVVFTDGEDQGSSAVIQTVEARLKRSEAPLFMIGQGRGNESESLQKIMRRLAEPTGGRALFEEKMENLREAFSEIRAELASQYLIGYVSTNDKRDGSWRRLRVEVEGRRKVRVREGYWAPSAP